METEISREYSRNGRCLKPERGEKEEKVGGRRKRKEEVREDCSTI